MRYGLFVVLLLLVCPNAPAQSRPYGTKNYVRLTVENDLLQLRENDARDQNFTNGVHLDLMNHRRSPVSFLLLEFPDNDGRAFDNLYVYSLGQEMYTPQCLTATAIQTNYLGAGAMLRMGSVNNYFQNATGLYDREACVDQVANKRLYSHQEEAQTRQINRLDSVGDAGRADKIRNRQKDQLTEGRSNRRFQAYTFIRPVARVVLDNSFLQGAGWQVGATRTPFGPKT